ncbi:beta-lactamase-like protein [Hypoxylon fragiforme]|uniref:beta-lactamase-like protein n=1 Tax=Hypoxylon fragiforme TaxID=63214 RepID=UPI0020C69A39|nr:beta-lactamase-like protein [Hypoxylon fragiforme]KAI2614670.1 beta-lactamase-like protein [Hypoxylon fragiforme]
MAQPAPELNIPASTATVDVSIINTSSILYGLDTTRFFGPQVPGHEYLAGPCYSFLIQHPVLKRSLVFDLGVRKDVENTPRPLLEAAKAGGVGISVSKDVREILDENGVDAKTIEAVIWSHAHFDHTGNPARFDPNTALIVGPGVKEHLFPGYPANQHVMFLEADYADREVKQLDFTAGTPFKIGQLPAIDYFGDGSFYFLDTPGHCIGHVCGFARVTSNPDSFVLMGGDVVHHEGELRPSRFHPLPDSISPHPFDPNGDSAPCPGHLFEKLLHDGKKDEPFYRATTVDQHGYPSVHHDAALRVETVFKVQEHDAHNNILFVPAHSHYMLNVVDFFPAKANDFVKKGWVGKTRWSFLANFAKAVGHEGKVEAAGDYNTPHTS